MTSLQKKILTVLAVAAVVICLSLFFIIKNSSEILKSKLEKSLGKDFRVQRIVLNWGSLDAYGIKYFRDGNEIASADSLNVRADFLNLLKRHYAVSSISIENPYLNVVINREGKLLLPFISIEKEKEGTERTKSITAFAVGRISIDNGRVHLMDERLPVNQNSIDVNMLNIKFDNLVYPFEDGFSDIKFSAASEGRLISGNFSAEGKVNFKAVDLNMRFNGSDIVLLDADKKGPILRAVSIAFSVVSRDSQEGKVYIFDDAVVKKPYLRYDTDQEGDLVNPWKDMIIELRRVISSSPK